MGRENYPKPVDFASWESQIIIDWIKGGILWVSENLSFNNWSILLGVQSIFHVLCPSLLLLYATSCGTEPWLKIGLEVGLYKHNTRGHFMYVPTQWETTLRCKVASHWLDTYTKWSQQSLKKKKKICIQLMLSCVLMMFGEILLDSYLSWLLHWHWGM